MYILRVLQNETSPTQECGAGAAIIFPFPLPYYRHRLSTLCVTGLAFYSVAPLLTRNRERNLALLQSVWFWG